MKVVFSFHKSPENTLEASSEAQIKLIEWFLLLHFDMQIRAS